MSEVSENQPPVTQVPETTESHPQPQETPADDGKKFEETEEERAKRLAAQEEIDSRSVYVGNVDYRTTPEQLEEFFNVVGVIERITILFDKFTGLPKGYAYIEFVDVPSVEKAIADLHGKTFRGRELRVTSKRTNVPGFSKRGSFRGRGRGGFNGRGRGRGSFRGRGRGKSFVPRDNEKSKELADESKETKEPKENGNDA